MDEYRQAVGALPASLAGPLAQLAAETARRVHEVRLRAGCPVWLNVGGALRPAAETPGCPGALAALLMEASSVDLASVVCQHDCVDDPDDEIEHCTDKNYAACLMRWLMAPVGEAPQDETKS